MPTLLLVPTEDASEATHVTWHDRVLSIIGGLQAIEEVEPWYRLVLPTNTEIIDLCLQRREQMRARGVVYLESDGWVTQTLHRVLGGVVNPSSP